MHRKDFVKILGAAALLPEVNIQSKFEVDLEVTKAPRLKRGDKIGLVAPGGFITEDELKQSADNLKNLGFIPVASQNILEKYGYLGGTDQMRASDLNKMFSRKDISGIMCARGGYGCARILPMLDYDLIRNNPKVLIGYSDITALLYAIFKKTGIVCFHGPVGISTFNDFSIQYFDDVLLNPYPELELISARENDNEPKLTTIRSGKCSGKLIGGNLSIVVSMLGTQFDIDGKEKIIFLEEVEEEPYRIDRMLTQMIQAGKFEDAAGIALGTFSKCEAKEKEPAFPKSLTLFEVLVDRLGDLGIPVIYGLSFGHITNKFTLPFGVNAELNTVNQTLKLLEPAVI